MTELSLAARNAAVNALTALADAGAGPAEFRFYSAGFAELLATAVSTQVPSFDPAAGGISALAAPIPGVSVLATGEAALFTLTDSDGNIVLEGDVGLIGSGADIEFSSVSWVIGDAIDLSTYTLTVPAME